MNLNTISKLEFWALAVPSLIASIGAIAYYGCWRMLWVFAVEFELATVLHFGRGLVTELLCEPRTNACRAGKWPKAFALELLIPAYNWYIKTMFADIVYLVIAWRFREAMPLPFVYTTVFAASFGLLCLTRTLQGRTDGGYGEIITEAERWLLLSAIPTSVFFVFTPGLFALCFAVAGVVVVGWLAALWYRPEHKKCLEYHEADKKGVRFTWTVQRHWFPRPGVIYEPDQQPLGPLAGVFSKGDLNKVRREMTVEYVYPAAFVSLALLLGGAAVLVDIGHGLCLFTFAGAMVLWFLFSAFTEEEKYDTWIGTFCNSVPYAMSYLLLSYIILGFCGDSWTRRLALAAFLVGSFEFPWRYVVRSTTKKRPDWLRPIFTTAAVALALAFNAAGIPWYLSGFAATFAAYPLVALRKRWPLRPLSGREKAHTYSPTEGCPRQGGAMRAAASGAVSGDLAAKTRRERKRERQMSAFRRSMKKG